jgi:hypothetical protein
LRAPDGDGDTIPDTVGEDDDGDDFTDKRGSWPPTVWTPA